MATKKPPRYLINPISGRRIKTSKGLHSVTLCRELSTVRALASQGGGIVLENALDSTSPADHLTVSPLLRGNNPYP